MLLSELAAAVSVRCRPKPTQSEMDAWIADVESLGIKPGPALADAVKSWASNRKYNSLPTPKEFRAYYAPVSSGQAAGSLQMVWRQIRKPAEQFARDHLVHVQLMQADDHSVTLWPLCSTARRWWEQPDHAAEVGRLIGRDVRVMERET